MDKQKVGHLYHGGNTQQQTGTQARTWVNLKDIMLNERGQTQKATNCMIYMKF